MAKQTHTYIVRFPKGGTDCMLCGAEIKKGEFCEETRMQGESIYDDEISHCCRKCTEGECPEEYAAAEASREACVFCQTKDANAQHSRTCENR